MIASVAFFILTVTELGFCQNSCDPETRFQCPGGLCFSRAKVCNNVRDCTAGEDERNCESAYCMTRNLTMAKLNKYTACRKQCLSDDDCSGRKTCVCDDECGKSCLNSDAECGPPPRITNMKSFWVYGGQIPRRIRSRSYRHGSYVKYICKSGFTLKGPVPRCNGRKQWSGERPTCVGTSCVGMWPNIPHAQYKGPPHLYGTGREIGDVLKYKCDEGYTRVGGKVTCGPDAQWTKFRCVVTCLKAYDYTAEIRLELTCGRQCETNSDCLRGEFCKCDGPCSRVCVSENMDCGMAPTVAHANVTINGSIARYECHKGYYLASGKLTVHCIGSGNIWDNSNRPVCEPVLCGDPSASIEETRGRLIDERNFYYYDTVVNFSCPRDYKLTGSPTRRCMSNGQWSGELTVCHIRDRNQDRCPHPGRPINGQIIGNVIGNIGDIVRFECDEGYIMYGLAVQECLWFREWSGSRTPECVDYRYPHTASNLIGTLTRSLENLPDVEIGVHRSINLNDMNEKHEIYLVFDISETVLFVENQLDNEIKFAIRLVRRLERFGENVHYCIILFASECITLRNVSTSGQNADEVVEQLLDILSDVRAGTYDKMRPAGRATLKALYEVQTQIDFNYEEEPSRKKHVFMFVGGKDTEDENPVDIKRNVEASYENTEFYSITACSICNKEVIEQLKLLSTSKEEDGKNFIQLEDFYRLSHYLDKVTDVNKDYSACGKSGNQESVKKLASTVDEITDKGENAEEDAWRWQVLITQRDSSIVRTVSQDTNIIGGGSIINEHWVLTAAHVLNERRLNPQDLSWMDKIALFVGIVDRPTRMNELKKSVKAYEMKSYKEHPGFTWNFDNDIALIEVGARLQDDMTSTYEGEGLTFGYYVRPVCLPCTGTCVTNEHLADVGGVSYDSMNDDERCKAEETFLLDHYAMTIVTGFGHTEKEVEQSSRIKVARRLQMVLLRIARNITCEDGMTALKQIRQSYRYTDKMICCKSGSPLKPYGACKGDSGGALVRRVMHRGGTGNREKNDYCWVAIGIVSFGIGCASGEHPGYYTNVARYVQWIHMIINDSGCTEDPPTVKHAGKVEVFRNDMQGNPVPIMLAPYPYGSYATYYCDPSYRLEEPSMSCNIGKEWEGRPTCVGIPCEAPTDEPNSYSIARHFIAGNYYNFRCQLGYYMDGNSTRLCQAGRLWSTLQHRCNITTCNPLGKISNGRIETTVGLNFGSKASVRCNSGYRTTSTSQMRCSADPRGLRFAKWLGRLPSCIRIKCPMPEPPRNGFIRNIKRVKLRYGSSIDFQCNPGYKLKGPAHGTCNDMEEWGEKPLCIVDLDCDFVNSFCGYGARNWERLRSIGAEGNEEPVIRSLGESYLKSLEVPRGWTNHFVCLKFYYKLSERGRLNVERMNGTVLWATHTNEKIGKWSNASLTIDASSGLQFRFHANKDDIMIYEITANGEECENHCILSPCQNGGTCYNRINDRKCFCTVEFTGDDCSIDRRCAPPELEIGNGSRLSLNSRMPDSTIRYKCNENYTFDWRPGVRVKEKVVSCHEYTARGESLWEPKPSSLRCEKITCPLITIRPNTVLYNPEQSRRESVVGETATFRCEYGFKKTAGSTMHIICVNSGSWSDEPPICVELPCEFPDLPQFSYTEDLDYRDDEFPSGTVLSIDCESTHVRTGTNHQWRCNNGTWITSDTECVVYLENLLYAESAIERGILKNDINRKHEIYFVFDVSRSVLKDDDQLDDGIKFAIRLVRRLEHFQGSIHYGIVVFASDFVTTRNVSYYALNTDIIVQDLLDVLPNAKAGAYIRRTRSGTATWRALREIQRQIGLNYGNDPDRKKHVFLFTDGMHTEGRNPIAIKREIELSYRNTEFFAITSCNDCSVKGLHELKSLSSGERNFIRIEDFHLMSKYLDIVTDMTEDYSECGKNGNQESVKKLASRIGTDKGENAEADQWRWHVLITRRGTTITGTLADEEYAIGASSSSYILGGAAVINELWMLTSAVIFMRVGREDAWMSLYALFVGIVERPISSADAVEGSVQAYEIKDYISHPGFSRDFNNDIALIRVGARLHHDMTTRYEGEGLTLGYYIRPVCLPCTGTCVRNEDLVDEHGNSLIKNAMSDEEKCRVEEKILRERRRMSVVTGFGHTNRSPGLEHRPIPAKRLQMGLLQILSDEECESEIQNFQRQTRRPTSYTENMICCASANKTKNYDACAGDSGGPLVVRVRHSAEGEDDCWVAVGIVSFGYGCARGDIPGYYTNVARYVQWINETTGGMLPPH